jgi:histone acetyltransferase 1
MAAEIQSSKLFEKLKVYRCFADECIFFKYIFDESDLNRPDTDDTVFKPEFVHQIFGDEETIFGYKGLRVNYYLTPGTLEACINLDFKEKLTAQRFDGIEADDIYEAFTKFGCSAGFTRNPDVFCSEKLVADRQFKPYGAKVHEYTREVKSANGSSSSRSFEVYKIDATMPEFTNPKFLEYIDRVQTMLVFFIETASFVDTEDPQWTFFLVYEKRKLSNSEFRYATIGFLSLYNYYAYPDKVRARVSQVLVMPTYQNMGHGAELLESVYRDAVNDSNVIDITAESPSPEFMKIRDFVTTKMCCTLSSFQDKALLKAGFSIEMAAEALRKLKIPRLQSRRCYEVMRLWATSPNAEDDWRSYRLDIKKRFYMPFIKRSKYARNAGAVSNQEYNKEPMASSSGNARDTKIKTNFESRFMDSGVTTIGFGNPPGRSTASSAPVTTIGFTRVNSASGSAMVGQAAAATSIARTNVNGPVATVNGVTANGTKKVGINNYQELSFKLLCIN